MELEALELAIDALAASDPVAYADRESMEALQRALARLEAFATKAAAAFETSGAWAPDGAQTAASWMAAVCHLPNGQARRLLRRGRALAQLPDTERAWSTGQITGAQVDTLVGLRRAATAESLARDEALLVEQARTLRFESFVRTTAYWEQLADPDGTEAAAEARRARRDVSLAASFQGMWLGRLTLDPIAGAIVSDELTRLEEGLFEADWAEARASLGRDPKAGDLARTGAQRRADALVEMATRSKTAPEDGRRPAPLFSVLIDHPTLKGRVCELAQGVALTPGALLPWLEVAHVERVVFGPGVRAEVSPTARLFTGATRRAIELRDRQCTHPYCDRPAASCQVDHIIPFHAGGPTTQENGRVLCAFHNRLRNQRPPPGPEAV